MQSVYRCQYYILIVRKRVSKINQNAILFTPINGIWRWGYCTWQSCVAYAKWIWMFGCARNVFSNSDDDSNRELDELRTRDVNVGEFLENIENNEIKWKEWEWRRNILPKHSWVQWSRINPNNPMLPTFRGRHNFSTTSTWHSNQP